MKPSKSAAIGLATSSVYTSCCAADSAKHASNVNVASSSPEVTVTVVFDGIAMHGSPSAGVDSRHRTATRTGSRAAAEVASPEPMGYGGLLWHVST